MPNKAVVCGEQPDSHRASQVRVGKASPHKLGSDIVQDSTPKA